MQTRERAHCAHSVFPFIKKRPRGVRLLLAIVMGGVGGVALAIDPGRGPTSTVRPSLTSPTPSHMYKRAQQTGTADYSQWQLSALLSSPAYGVLALQEVLSTTPTRLLPPFPCIGHHSPPSASAASFRNVPSRELLDRSPPWASNGQA